MCRTSYDPSVRDQCARAVDAAWRGAVKKTEQRTGKNWTVAYLGGGSKLPGKPLLLEFQDQTTKVYIVWALLCGTHWLYLSHFSSDPAAARQLTIQYTLLIPPRGNCISCSIQRKYHHTRPQYTINTLLD